MRYPLSPGKAYRALCNFGKAASLESEARGSQSGTRRKVSPPVPFCRGSISSALSRLNLHSLGLQVKFKTLDVGILDGPGFAGIFRRVGSVVAK